MQVFARGLILQGMYGGPARFLFSINKLVDISESNLQKNENGMWSWEITPGTSVDCKVVTRYERVDFSISFLGVKFSITLIEGSWLFNLFAKKIVEIDVITHSLNLERDKTQQIVGFLKAGWTVRDPRLEEYVPEEYKKDQYDPQEQIRVDERQYQKL